MKAISFTNKSSITVSWTKADELFRDSLTEEVIHLFKSYVDVSYSDNGGYNMGGKTKCMVSFYHWTWYV